MFPRYNVFKEFVIFSVTEFYILFMNKFVVIFL